MDQCIKQASKKLVVEKVIHAHVKKKNSNNTKAYTVKLAFLPPHTLSLPTIIPIRLLYNLPEIAYIGVPLVAQQVMNST